MLLRFTPPQALAAANSALAGHRARSDGVALGSPVGGTLRLETPRRGVRQLRHCWVAALLAGAAAHATAEVGEPRGLIEAMDDPRRRLRISWHGSFYKEGGQLGSWIQRQIEARYNLELFPSFLPAFSYDRLLTFRLIGGEIPDVYWVRDARLLQRAALHGFALEVPYEVIVRHAPNYARRLRETAPDGWLLSLYQGRNYGLPNFNLRQSLYPHVGLWNKTWLERVGIGKTPETLEEMEEALRRFREDDPDRDGVKDTFGYCPWKPGSSGGFGSNGTLDRSFEEIFGAFGIAHNAWLLREGRVVWGGILPEAREVLALLRRWYAGGLIHPDYMTLPMGNIEVRTQLIGGRVGYITGLNLGNPNAFDRRIPTSPAALHAAVNPGEELAPAWHPIGPRGHRGTRAWAGSIGGVMAFGPQLAREPEKLIRVLRLFDDAARDPQLHHELVYAKRGLHWEWRDELGMTKLPPYDKKAFGAVELLGESAVLEPGDNHGYFIPFSCTAAELERWTTPSSQQFRATHMKPEWGIHDVLLMNDTVPSSGKYLPHVVELQAITYTSIITGKLPLEAFEQFVERWHIEGGAVLTREANQLYREKEAIRGRVDALLGVAGKHAP